MWWAGKQGAGCKEEWIQFPCNQHPFCYSQHIHNFIANALKLRLSCINPSTFFHSLFTWRSPELSPSSFLCHSACTFMLVPPRSVSPGNWWEYWSASLQPPTFCLGSPSSGIFSRACAMVAYSCCVVWMPWWHRSISQSRSILISMSTWVRAQAN